MSASRSITVLALNESEREALLDWSRGLDWVSWLLSGIRARLGPAASAAGDEVAVRAAWDRFACELFLPVLGPALREAWQAAQEGRTRRLASLALELDQKLPAAARERSQEAARILLRGTRGAAFQDVLGKHRAAIADGRCPAHLVCVWAATGVLFQLGLANVCAEYLRLEWAMLGSRHPGLPGEPEGACGILALTGRIIQESTEALKIRQPFGNAELDATEMTAQYPPRLRNIARLENRQAQFEA